MNDTLSEIRTEQNRRKVAALAAITRFSGLEPELDNSAWVCYIGFQNEGYKPKPVAAFTQKEFAIALSESLEGDFPPTKVKIGKISLPVNRYVDKLKEGKKPFYVSLNRDASFFEGTESYVTNLEELTFEEHFKLISSLDSDDDCDGFVSGTFWAYTKTHAEERAEDLRRQSIDAITSHEH